jgi:hypothetical protein
VCSGIVSATDSNTVPKFQFTRPSLVFRAAAYAPPL